MYNPGPYPPAPVNEMCQGAANSKMQAGMELDLFRPPNPHYFRDRKKYYI